MSSKLEKDVLRFLCLLVCVILGCRLTNGWAAWGIVAIGCWASFSGRLSIAITCFVLLPLLISLSPVLVSGSSQLGVAARIGQLPIVLGMLASPQIRERRKEYIPLVWLFVYALVAVLSSAGGWMPLISYFKIVNFVFFVFEVIIFSRAIQASDEELYQLKVVLLGLATFIVVGSILAYFIPSVGYSMEVRKAAIWGNQITGKDVAARHGRKWFSGVMNHSQMLASIVPLCLAWSLYDMILVERKLLRLHLSIITATPILMFMSRSRTALLIFCVSMFLIFFYCLPLVKMDPMIKHRIKRIMYVFIGLLVIGATFAEIRNGLISRWIRKTDDIETDSRSVGEALTSSRMGLVEYNLNDFKLNPLLGKGFQVMDWHYAAYKAHKISLMSAPIEKGNLPLMVLGETGLVGAAVFIVFLCSFYATCVRKKYRALFCLFTVLLALNMSEANFFSPGGSALHWTIAVIGGFCLDLLEKRRGEDVSEAIPEKVLS